MNVINKDFILIRTCKTREMEDEALLDFSLDVLEALCKD
jgi:hypothetical protein